MNPTTKQTPAPTPWQLYQTTETWRIYSGDWEVAESICGRSDAQREANARQIVHCVNMHDELLEALRACVIPLERLGDFVGNTDKGGVSGLGPFDRCAILLAARDALAKADKGEA